MTLSRRDFLSSAAAIFGVATQCSFLSAAESVVAQDQLPLLHSIPFILSQEAYRESKPPSTSTLISVAKNEWGFDGIELSARMLLEEWGGVTLTEQVQGQILQAAATSDGRKPFVMALTIDLATTKNPNDVLEAALSAIRRLPIETCSIIVATEEDDEIRSEKISSLSEQIESARRGTKVLIENTRVSSGASADRFMESIRKLPGCTGTLIRSDSIQYRFDLAVQDIRLARNGCKGDRPLAIRIKCKTTTLTTSEAAEFDREVLRQTIEKQIAPHLGEMKPLYVAIDSSLALRIQAAVDGKTSVGSKTFRDMIVLVRKELSALPK
ncbi:MAG: hypothetical protein JWP89_5182 [Schlesneria sp.]|nr:hypothetical protein [Schlesneria sp.]